jgi:hypothetical protein
VVPDQVEEQATTAISAEMRAPNLQDQTVTARGKVTGVEQSSDGTKVTLDVWTEHDRGNRLAPGTCTAWIDR